MQYESRPPVHQNSSYDFPPQAREPYGNYAPPQQQEYNGASYDRRAPAPAAPPPMQQSQQSYEQETWHQAAPAVERDMGSTWRRSGVATGSQPAPAADGGGGFFDPPSTLDAALEEAPAPEAPAGPRVENDLRALLAKVAVDESKFAAAGHVSFDSLCLLDNAALVALCKGCGLKLGKIAVIRRAVAMQKDSRGLGQPAPASPAAAAARPAPPTPDPFGGAVAQAAVPLPAGGPAMDIATPEWAR